jgi:hypothetical protein
MEHLDEELPAHVLFLETVGSELDVEMASEIDFDGWVAYLEGPISAAENLDPVPGWKVFER